MTAIQHRYYAAIRDFIVSKGYGPSLREICKMVGVKSLATAHKAVHNLVDQGYLTYTEGHPYRGLIVVPEKMHNFNGCNRGHPSIWFLTPSCPLCQVLQRFRQGG